MRDPERSGLVPFDLHIHDLDSWCTLRKPDSVTCDRARGESQDYIHACIIIPISSSRGGRGTTANMRSSPIPLQFEKAVVEYKGGKLTVYHQDGKTEEIAGEEGAAENGINLPNSNAYYNEIRYFTTACSRERLRQGAADELETVLELIAKLADLMETARERAYFAPRPLLFRRFRMRRCVIFAPRRIFAGDRPGGVRREDFVIACDGGYRHALSCGVRPDAFVGISIPIWAICPAISRSTARPRKRTTPTACSRSSWHGKRLQRLPAARATGGRMDHLLGNLACAAYIAKMGGRCEIATGTSRWSP